MKIRISNLGPIQDEAQFELKPLTIFIGPNNAGKTWLAYTLAAIFGRFGMNLFTDDERTASILNTYPPIAETIDTLLQTGLASLNIYEFADKYVESYFNDIISCMRDNLRPFMGTRLVSFDDLHFSLDLGDRKIDLLKQIQETGLRIHLGPPQEASSDDHAYEKRENLFTIRKQRGRKTLNIYFTFEGQKEIQFPREIVEEVLIWYIFRMFHRALFYNVVILPTERTTFLTMPLSKQSVKQKLSEQEINQIKEQGIRPLSGPMSEYISSVMSVNNIGPAKIGERKRQAKTNAQVQTYIDLSHLLEQQILNGKLDFSTPEPNFDREMLYYPYNSNESLEISMASSMVKELAPLVFHLRYFAEPNELLIIDEPEMNLHPKAQVQVIEFLAMLANAGLNILITTHSPYITDHLLNLTKAKQLSEQEVTAKRFFLQDRRAFIDDKDVSLYLIDQGKIINAQDEDADWNTFGKIADQISDIYFSL